MRAAGPPVTWQAFSRPAPVPSNKMQALNCSNMSARRSVGGARLQTRAPARAVSRSAQPTRAADHPTVLIGLAADSGCGKSTFMRRMTNLFGGSAKPPAGGNPDSNTLISELTTVICLDDYPLVRFSACAGCGAAGARHGPGSQGRGEPRAEALTRLPCVRSTTVRAARRPR